MKTKLAIMILLVYCTTNQIIGMSRKAFLVGAALASATTTVALGSNYYKNWIISKALEKEESQSKKVALMEPISKSNE